MTANNLPPTAVALAFVDHINRGNLNGLVAMMSEGHRLEVFDEEPVIGREANAAAWRRYMAAFPRYQIYLRRINATGAVVAILGHTTGSHLGLPDAEEREFTLLWLAYVRKGTVERWQLIEDSPSNRQQFGLDG
jgi:hypothetical protein